MVQCNQRVFFAAKRYIKAIDLTNFDLAAAKRHTQYFRLGPVFSRHGNAHRIRMVHFRIRTLQCNLQPCFCCQLKGIAQPRIVGRKAQKASYECFICAVPFIRFCKRAVYGQRRCCRFIMQDFPGHQTNSGSPGCMGTGRSDHDRPDNIKYTHVFSPFRSKKYSCLSASCKYRFLSQGSD